MNCNEHDYSSATQQCPDCFSAHPTQESIGLVELPSWWTPAVLPTLVRNPDGSWYEDHEHTAGTGLLCGYHGMRFARYRACRVCVTEDTES